MTDLLTGLLTFALLIGALLFMVRGSRGVKGPARSWRDLADYNLEGQMWAVALLTGMAIGEIAQRAESGAASFGAFALLGGVWCGWFRTPSRLAGAIPGIIGVVASLLGSVFFFAEAPTTTDRVIRGAILCCLGLLFLLSAVTRAQPLAGLTWFAALDVVVFLSGPLGVSWAQIGGPSAGVVSLIGIGAAIALALMPEVAISLAAFAVIAVQLIGAGTGYLPGRFGYSLGMIVVTMIGFGIVRWVRGRFA